MRHTATHYLHSFSQSTDPHANLGAILAIGSLGLLPFLAVEV